MLGNRTKFLVNILKVLTALILVLLVYVALGTFLYPLWWYPILVEHKLPWLYLFEGIADAFRLYYLPIIQTTIVVATVVLLSRNSFSKKMRIELYSVYHSSTFLWMTAALGMFLIIVNIILIAGLEDRTREERESQAKLEASLHNLNETMAKYEKETEEAKQLVPLSQPANFFFLDKGSADSLYGQYEPDLVPSLVLEEMQESSELRGKIGVNEYVATDIGKKELSRKMTEYRSISKNAERKVRDLLQYLYDKSRFRTFRDIQPKSESLAELDKATRMLEQKHNLKIDTSLLQAERVKLMGQELKLTEEQLRDLHGLTLVEGYWTFREEGGNLIIERDFVDNVPNSPKCQVKISASEVSPKDLDIMRNLPKKVMRLSVFGNALAGLTDSSRVILVKPVAIY